MRKCVGLIILIGWLAGGSVSATDQKNQVIVFNSITFNENWSDLFLKMIYRQISDRDSIVFETYELVLPRLKKEADVELLRRDILKKYLIEDEADPTSENDFGNNIIPNLLRDGRKMYAYHFNGYWKDVGTIPSLWEANMEVLDPEHSGINLFDENWKIYSRNSGMTGHRIGENAVLDNCLITDGCNIKGTVRHSILFSGVTVEEGAIVEDAVVMGHSMIKAGAVVRHCIIAENATIEEDAVVGAKPKGEGIGEVATIAADVTIGKGAKIGPSAMIYEDVKEGEEQC